MNILGIHDGHNAAAALLRDGVVVAAIQEERLTRVKNHDAFPARAAARALEIAGLRPAEIDVIAMAGLHQPRHRRPEDLMRAVRAAGAGGWADRLRRLARRSPANSLFRGMRRAERLAEVAAAGLPDANVEFIEHHTAHAAAAAWGGPFRGQPFLALTCDGAGDDLCATVSIVRGGRVERRWAVAEEHSPAMAYLIVTQLLGMTPNEHEYKVMGLAPYARGDAPERWLAVFRSLFEFEPGGAPGWRRRPGVPHAFALYPYLRGRLEGARFDHLAAALQQWFEEMMCEWIRRAIAATGVPRVALAGGAFLNVKANRAIARLPEVEGLFVFPSCGDESNAIGAALAASVAGGQTSLPPPLGSLYLGDEFGDDAIDAALRHAGAGLTVYRPDDLPGALASMLEKGQIVARFAGRAEFGARALGNRSLLADPGRPEVVRKLNDAIKDRDFWMPFAATVRGARVGDYLVNPRGLPAPHMMMAFDSTDRRGDIAAAIHPCDHTIRPQVLDPADNPGYDELLAAFEARAGCGALLNTSFNIHGEPMVYSPEDALDVLRRSGLRWLAMGDRLIGKQ